MADRVERIDHMMALLHAIQYRKQRERERESSCAETGQQTIPDSLLSRLGRRAAREDEGVSILLTLLHYYTHKDTLTDATLPLAQPTPNHSSPLTKRRIVPLASSCHTSSSAYVSIHSCETEESGGSAKSGEGKEDVNQYSR